MRGRALLTGHFTTVGDVDCLEVVRGWLDAAGIPCDVAPFFDSIVPRLPGSIALDQVDAERYSHLVIVCGPVWDRQLSEVGLDLHRFAGCVRLGVNLTMVQPLAEWNPFDVLLARDSEEAARPDLAFAGRAGGATLAARCVVKRQSSYRGRERHEEAIGLLDALVERHDLARIDVDTMWARRGNGLRSSAHVLEAMRRVDVVLTNRLHGMVFAIRAGTPPIVIDAIEGTAKVAAQARAIGWPQCIPVAEATEERLDQALAWCRSPAAGEAIRACMERARADREDMRARFLRAVESDIRPGPLPPRRRSFTRWIRRRT